MEKRSSKNQWFCQFIVTIEDLLGHLSSVQQSDASCDYTLRSEPNSLSPRSDGYSLTDIVEKESHVTQTMTTSTVTTTPETPAKQTSGLTVSMPHVTTPETPAKQTSVDQTLHESNTKASLSPVTPPNPAPETKNWLTWMIWTSVIAAVAGFVMVIFLGLTLLFTSGRNEDGCRRSLNSGEYLPGGYDETYSIVTYKFIESDGCAYMRSLNSGEYLPSGYDETYSTLRY
ncbi:uncharacterized protein LOC113745883 [Larimichthys crocea]|uniref:uncharacterized protein LOC113745883 n=1 Tax=Larimichthys crocea TaxID=215358 RepID=UPI000F5E3E28|nr:uncharacterized protein LOC113745883 [Larimichthys crocea]